MKRKPELTRISNDANGNPRYVCHFLDLIDTFEGQFTSLTNKDGSIMSANEVCNYIHGLSICEYRYSIALRKARTIGGRKYNTKSYGGGIVFQSYNVEQLAKDIMELQEGAEQ